MTACELQDVEPEVNEPQNDDSLAQDCIVGETDMADSENISLKAVAPVAGAAGTGTEVVGSR